MHDPARRSGASHQDSSERSRLDRHASPDLGRTLFALATSVVPFVGLWALMYLALQVNYLLVLALAVPAAGFLLRTYILFHDCAHGSLLKGRRANACLGAFLGLLVFTPRARWRHDHIVHHATAGDLDRRGTGDIHTLTVTEYDALSRRGRIGYRLFRNPVVMFGVGPIWSMLVMPRWVHGSAHPRIKRSTYGLDLALVLVVGTLCWWLGWREVLLVLAPLVPLAGGTGIWLFYVQHQFEGAYWEHSEHWSYTDAAMQGSSFLQLPWLLRFFSANIGFHHVHHLNPTIPNYHLPRAHAENAVFQAVPRVSLFDALRSVRLKLWDEDAARLVTWAGGRRAVLRSRLQAA